MYVMKNISKGGNAMLTLTSDKGKCNYEGTGTDAELCADAAMGVRALIEFTARTTHTSFDEAMQTIIHLLILQNNGNKSSKD